MWVLGCVNPHHWHESELTQARVRHFEPALSLDGYDCDEHVEGDGGEAVLLEEGHEEAEADEDHHVHVLEHWGRKRLIKLEDNFLRALQKLRGPH